MYNSENSYEKNEELVGLTHQVNDNYDSSDDFITDSVISGTVDGYVPTWDRH